MIEIQLSERDFDYEIQALVNSFFPGQYSQVVVKQDEVQKEEVVSEKQEMDMVVLVEMTITDITIRVQTEKMEKQSALSVTGGEDWHKHEGKTVHPYRTWYKNQLKKLLFQMLRDFPEEGIPEQIRRRIPAWGTMTGVRPTKISMNELLSGKNREMVRHTLLDTYCCSEEKADLGMRIAEREAGLLEQVDYENGYSIYIGIPFCPTTCLYCSFPSYPYEKFGHLADQYLQALKREISAVSELGGAKKVTSIYIGGGTPTTLTASQLEELIVHIRKCFPAESSYEFTVEAGRADSITREKLAVLRGCGVDRISVNPQTMQQKTLDMIGRKHTVEQTVQAFQMARELGFSNINMDLIIGLPGETEEDFADTLRQIRQLNPDSLTIHSLVIKRASRLRSLLEERGALGESEEVRAERMERMLQMGQQFADQQGYQPYYMYRQKNSAGHAGSTGQENIGYARAGKECLYNILIMEEKQTILAVGAGASTKQYRPDLQQVRRIENVKSVTDYIERVDEMIARKGQMLEEW